MQDWPDRDREINREREQEREREREREGWVCNAIVLFGRLTTRKTTHHLATESQIDVKWILC